MSSIAEDIEKAFLNWQACHSAYEDLNLQASEASRLATHLSNQKNDAAKAEKAAWQKVAELREKQAPR